MKSVNAEEQERPEDVFRVLLGRSPRPGRPPSKNSADNGTVKKVMEDGTQALSSQRVDTVIKGEWKPLRYRRQNGGKDDNKNSVTSRNFKPDAQADQESLR